MTAEPSASESAFSCKPPQLPDQLRVAEAVELFASFYRRRGDGDELLEEWGLGPRRSSAFADLSGGERQRLFVVLALVNEPDVVFLDEITTGLDPDARRTAWTALARVRDEGAAVVLVTTKCASSNASAIGWLSWTPVESSSTPVRRWRRHRSVTHG